MNPLQTPSSGKKKVRKACNSCPACLAPPCNECSICRNSKSHKKCKQRVCPNLALSSPSPSQSTASECLSGGIAGGRHSSDSAGASRTSPQVSYELLDAQSQSTSNLPQALSNSSTLASGSSDNRVLTSNISTALLSALPQSAARLFDHPSTSSEQLSEEGPGNRRSSVSQEDVEETGGRKRQRLQEEHLRVEAVAKKFVLAKKNPSGAAGLIYQCLKCDIDFPTKIMCIRHAMSCGKLFTGKRRAKNTRKITCNICPFKATTEGDLARHRRRAHPELCSQRVRCLTCNDTFATVKILKKHILTVHKNGAQEECEYCDKKFANRANLKRHRATHLKSQLEKEMERANFRQVDLAQWDESLGEGHGVGTSRDDLGDLTEEVDKAASDGTGSDVDDDTDLSSASGFSINQLKDAFMERCRQMGDSEAVLNERRQALERRLVKVSHAISSPPASNNPSSPTPQVDLGQEVLDCCTARTFKGRSKQPNLKLIM